MREWQLLHGRPLLQGEPPRQVDPPAETTLAAALGKRSQGEGFQVNPPEEAAVSGRRREREKSLKCQRGIFRLFFPKLQFASGRPPARDRHQWRI